MLRSMAFIGVVLALPGIALLIGGLDTGMHDVFRGGAALLTISIITIGVLVRSVRRKT